MIRLRYPPIVEAIVEVRVPPNSTLGIKAIASLGSTVAPEYPNAIRQDEHSIAMQGDQFVNHAKAVVGLAFASAKHERVFQARLDGVALNWLKPYESWERLTEEARHLFELYVTAARPSAISGVSVRFINQFPVEQGAKLSSIMNVELVVPKSLPQRMGTFSFQYTFPFEDGIVATVNSNIGPGEGADLLWTLDIEVVDHNPVEPVDLDLIWRRLERLRTVKNEIFFAVATEEQLRKFQ